MACGTLFHDTGHMSIWGIFSNACHTSRNSNISRFGTRQDSGTEGINQTEVKSNNGAILGYTLQPHT